MMVPNFSFFFFDGVDFQTPFVESGLGIAKGLTKNKERAPGMDGTEIEYKCNFKGRNCVGLHTCERIRIREKSTAVRCCHP